MADLGASQARQVENLKHSPAGQTGAPTGSSGNSYGAASDTSLGIDLKVLGLTKSPRTQLANFTNFIPQAHSNVVTVTDTVTVTDATAEHQVGHASVSDTVTVTDVVTPHVGISDQLSDTVTVTDATTGHQTDHAQVSDSIAITDATAEHQVGQVSVTDTVTVTDALATHNVVIRNVSDTVTVTDSATEHYGTGYILSDTVTVTDALAPHHAGTDLLSDTVTTSDALTTHGHGFNALSDTAATTDSLSAHAGAVVAAPSTVTVTDAVSRHQAGHVPASDTVSVSDAAAMGSTYGVPVSDTMIVSTGFAAVHGIVLQPTDTVVVSEHVGLDEIDHLHLSDTVSVSDSLGLQASFVAGVSESVPFMEGLSAGVTSIVSSGTTLQVTFPHGLRVDGTGDPINFVIGPTSPGGFPVTVLSSTPIIGISLVGSNASVLPNPGQLVGNTIQIPGASFDSTFIGQYLSLGTPTNPTPYARIVAVQSATLVTVDQQLIVDPLNGSIPWTLFTVEGVQLQTTKPTNGHTYSFSAMLLDMFGAPFSFTDFYSAEAPQPRISSVELLGEGQVVVTFSDPMLSDPFLTSPGEYSFTGPTKVSVTSVLQLSPNQIAIETVGMNSGSYQLTVNATGTPHDLAGNPIDPLFNQAVFTGSVPLTARSIFTDKGPLAKAPEVFQAGVHATVVDPVTLNLADGSLSPGMVGLSVTISGGVKNRGTFLITSIVSATRVKVVASFTIPDAAVMSWKVFDPRDGEIADDPSDVSVTINGVPTPAVEVVGLLGQIIMATPPADGDTVLVNYNWVCNPVIDFRRLNSKEFRFNSWNRDVGYIPDPSRHHYRYNNSLPVTSQYVVPTPIQSGTGAQVITTTEFNLPGAALTIADVDLTVRIGGVNGGDYIIASVIDGTHLTVTEPVQIFPDPGSGTLSWQVFDPDNLDERAPLAQPLQRDLKYRAYERAYTALLNDPSTLLFNSPTHRIAFPPLQRPLVASFINYQATGLPDNDSVAPWTRHGSGTAAVVNNELVVTSSSAGPPFPQGQPIFWTRPIDLTFPNVFATSWRLFINADPLPEGVFTGIAVGFSDDIRCVVVGFLDNAGTRMIGILRAGAGNDPSQLSSWIGGLDALGNPTNAPATLDWTTIHSYRIYQDQSNNVSVFVEGGVVATLLVPETSVPFLSELNEPFNQLQGVFFGALSRLATSTSTWDFLRYEILPIDPTQFAPSLFVSYEADSDPEFAPSPWTPLGSHGTETIPHNGLLILDSTSATNAATETLSGLIGGDFRGFMKLEPLLSAASSVALDVNIQLLTYTHGIAPNAVMAAVDDGNFLIQLALFPDQAAPLYSYGGRSFPDQFVPYTWTKLGGQTPTLIGQLLRIADASVSDGLLYFIDDNPTPSAPTRVVGAANDYILEFRCRVNSHTPDPGGFSGVNAEVYDSFRDLGVLLLDVSGILYVALHSEGTVVAQFAFNWNDANFHTYRMVKNTLGNLVTLFVDTVLIGTANYSSFPTPLPSSPVGVTSFGSTTPASQMAQSVVDWVYCNVWRVNHVRHHYAGLWKGYDPNALTGYHLPLKASGRDARVAGNGIEDLNQDFVADGVVPGDVFIVDGGPNKGVYEITSVSPTVLTVSPISNPPVVQASSTMAGGSSFSASAHDMIPVAASMHGSSSIIAAANRDTTLLASSSLSASPTLNGEARAHVAGSSSFSATGTLISVTPSSSPFPVQPSQVNYRIPADVDWTIPHRYRIVRDPSGGVALFLDTIVAPLIQLGYNNIDLPLSSVGLPSAIADNLPSITWGAFDPTNLSETAWQYVRYGITKPSTSAAIVPPHQVFNQRNIIASYERHLTNIPHTLTDFWSESEGIPPQTVPDLLMNPGMTAYTLLNEGTPLVPSTQTYEVRRPTPVLVPVVGFNNPQDLLNSPAFVMNESEQRIELVVPPDVLYDSLQVIESDRGSPNLIAPFDDECQPYSLGTLSYQNVVCLTYNGTTFPELDPTAVTPWTFQADDPTHVNRSVAAGIFTYGTDSTGTRTIYRNATPLPDGPSLTTQVTFRLKLLNDASMGLGDSQVRFGLSAPSMTAALAFVTTPLGQRYVLIIDQNTNIVVGGIPFDFLDGNYHTYRLVRNPTATPPMPVPVPGPPPMPGMLQVFIDS